MVDVSKLKFVSCRSCGTYTAFDKDVLGTRITCEQCQASFVAQEYVPPIGSNRNTPAENYESQYSHSDHPGRNVGDSPSISNDKSLSAEEADIYWSYEDFVSAFQKKEIQVYVNHPAICSLCDSILEYAIKSSTAYKSSKLWFWLLPTLSVTSFFVIGWFGIAAVLISLGISLFKIGADVRHNAYDCIIEASLREPMVFRLLWGNEHLKIKKLT